MQDLIAITEIWRASAMSVATGETAPDGSPVFARETVKVAPGTRFTAPDAEAADLIEAGAAVLADAD